MAEVERQQEVFRVANNLFANTKTDWVTFFREILGVDGIIRQLYPTLEARAEFEKSADYSEILRMLKQLRERRPTDSEGRQCKQVKEELEPTRVITIRIPKSLHEALEVEARDHAVSVNKLCISKLVQLIDGALVPKKHRR